MDRLDLLALVRPTATEGRLRFILDLPADPSRLHRDVVVVIK